MSQSPPQHSLFDLTDKAATPKMRLRPYQEEAVAGVLKSFKQHSTTLGVAATGLGKTIIFAHVIDQMPPGRTMVLAHREELITQAAQKIEAVIGQKPEIEMANQWADLHSILGHSEVVVSSIQTQCAGKNGGRMTRFDPSQFNLVIIDEAHHATAKTYRRVIDHYRQNPDLKVFGVTATPDRRDKSALGQVFESVAFDFGILFGIKSGYLVPITQRSVNVSGLDFSKVRTTAGDLNRKDLAALMEYEQNLHEIAAPTIELAAGRKTLLFCASVTQSERMCEIFNRHKLDCARWICGETPKEDRRQILRDYAANRFQFLCNVGVLTEGFDDPSIEVVALARPTKSRSLFVQMVGRGTRVLPGVIEPHSTDEDRCEAIALSSKPCVEVIDFVGNAGKHKLINCTDILGGEYDDNIIERAKKMAEEEESKAVDPMQMLSEAAEERIREEKEAERREQARRAAVQAKAQFTTDLIDPFDVLAIKPRPETAKNMHRKPSERMMAMLERNGIKCDDANMSFTQAQQLIGTIIKRKDHGWCTFKQAKFLKKHGHDPKGIRFNEASQMIDQITHARGGSGGSSGNKTSGGTGGTSGGGGQHRPALAECASY